MAGIDMGIFFQILKDYVQNGPPEERKMQDEFTSRFLSVYDVLIKTANVIGYSRTVDVSKITFDDLEWIISEVECVPDAEVGEYEGAINEVDVLRDRVLKYYHSGVMTLNGIFENRSVRPIEDYF